MRSFTSVQAAWCQALQCLLISHHRLGLRVLRQPSRRPMRRQLLVSPNRKLPQLISFPMVVGAAEIPGNLLLILTVYVCYSVATHLGVYFS